MVAPFFKDFVFREQVENLELEWAEIKKPDQPLQPYHLMPEIILIDEPELGLYHHSFKEPVKKNN
jgi:hypothetical protein